MIVVEIHGQFCPLESCCYSWIRSSNRFDESRKTGQVVEIGGQFWVVIRGFVVRIDSTNHDFSSLKMTIFRIRQCILDLPSVRGSSDSFELRIHES